MSANDNVLLVGSVALDSSASVFKNVASALRGQIARIPDGETGPKRALWITSLARYVHFHPAFEPAGHTWTPDSGRLPEGRTAPKYRLKPNADPSSIEFESFGLADAAKDSYRVFEEMRVAGQIPADVRFQVSLPTPMALIAGLIDPDSQARAAAPIEKRLLTEFREICANAPAEDLALQWDICVEVYVWEGVRKVWFDNPKEGCINKIVEISDMVPKGAELGYHFCYTDFRPRLLDPRDTGVMVEMANRLAARIRRPLDWIHMPVPPERTDDAYYEPLAKLKLPEQTKVYLGLLYLPDGVEGALKRVAVARKFLPSFGVGAECGLGRKEASTIPQWLELHADCARKLTTVSAS